MMTPAQEPLLHMTGVSKTFGSVQALNEVEFQLLPGEVMALLGENGAGKSTLVKSLCGLVQLDAGQITIEGKTVDLSNPRRAREAGIAVVQQELSLVETLTVAENVVLGGGLKGLWTATRLAKLAKPHLETVGLVHLDPQTPVARLSVAERQLVEIARMLARQAHILILDEPTAALSDVEIERVLRVVRDLAKQGRGVIYVTHRLAEVFLIAQRVTIFRDGRSQPPLTVADLTLDDIISRMLGRSLGQLFPPRATALGEEVLSLEQLETHSLTAPVSLKVRAGEIVGLAGQLGSGAAKLLQAVAGLEPLLGGDMKLRRQPYAVRSIRSAIQQGVAYCSDDRQRDGIFPARPVVENLSAPSLKRITHFSWLSRRRERQLARAIAQTFAINPERLGFLASTFSGGNQQKLAVGKWLGIKPHVLLLEEPTRGVDVGARAEIYAHLRALAERGLAIVFASSDLPEVLGLADTVVSFYRGKVVRVAPAAALDQEQLLRDVTHEDSAAPDSPTREGRHG